MHIELQIREIHKSTNTVSPCTGVCCTLKVNCTSTAVQCCSVRGHFVRTCQEGERTVVLASTFPKRKSSQRNYRYPIMRCSDEKKTYFIMRHRQRVQFNNAASAEQLMSEAIETWIWIYGDIWMHIKWSKSRYEMHLHHVWSPFNNAARCTADPVVCRCFLASEAQIEKYKYKEF